MFLLVEHYWTLLLLVNWVCWLKPLNWHVCFLFFKLVLQTRVDFEGTFTFYKHIHFIAFHVIVTFFVCCFCSSQTVDPFGPTPRATVHVDVRGLSRGGCRTWPREDEDRGRARGFRHGSFHSHVRRAAERSGACSDGWKEFKMIKNREKMWVFLIWNGYGFGYGFVAVLASWNGEISPKRI